MLEFDAQPDAMTTKPWQPSSAENLFCKVCGNMGLKVARGTGTKLCWCGNLVSKVAPMKSLDH